MASSSFFAAVLDAWQSWNISTNPVLSLNDTPHRPDRLKVDKKRDLAEGGHVLVPASYTPEQVSLHDKADDCWIVIKDKVRFFLLVQQPFS